MSDGLGAKEGPQSDGEVARYLTNTSSSWRTDKARSLLCRRASLSKATTLGRLRFSECIRDERL